MTLLRRRASWQLENAEKPQLVNRAGASVDHNRDTQKRNATCQSSSLLLHQVFVVSHITIVVVVVNHVVPYLASTYGPVSFPNGSVNQSSDSPSSIGQPSGKATGDRDLDLQQLLLGARSLACWLVKLAQAGSK